ncbi:hypothetical protein EDC01DRAFT_631703 [Geopyxis carbonaria]|nr:hypothetical protein EDC01DRAFT_631703 [Geopyxis carbonaria]
MSSSPSTSTPGPGHSHDRRAARIRDNQRRSRARKREYLQSLESRLKRCQEEGVQANVELQKAARRVVEDNRLLRIMLEENGADAAYIDSRLAELRASKSAETTADDAGGEGESEALDTIFELPATAAGDDWMDMGMFGGGGGDDDECCGGAGGCGDGPMVMGTPQTNPPTPFSLDAFASPAMPASIEATYPPPLAIPPAPADIHSIVSPPLHQSPFLPHQPTVIPQKTKPGSCCPSTPATCGPLGICPPMSVPARTVPKETSTPCTVAYKLLKGLNQRREKERDMFEIVVELWQGFGDPPEGEEDGEGCRVEDAVLFKVVQGMFEK